MEKKLKKEIKDVQPARRKSDIRMNGSITLNTPEQIEWYNRPHPSERIRQLIDEAIAVEKGVKELEAHNAKIKSLEEQKLNLIKDLQSNDYDVATKARCKMDELDGDIYVEKQALFADTQKHERSRKMREEERDNKKRKSFEEEVS